MPDTQTETSGRQETDMHRSRRETARPTALARTDERQPVAWRDFERSVRDMERTMDALLRDVWEAGTYPFPLVSGLALQPSPAGGLRFRPFGSLTESIARLAEGWREPVLTWTLDEDKNEVEFRCEVPGLPKKDLDVEVTSDRIRVKGESRDHKYQAECIPGFPLNPDKADATYEDGVLRLHVGLTAPAAAQPRSVKIR